MLYQQNTITEFSALFVAAVYFSAYRTVVPKTLLIAWSMEFVALSIIRVVISLRFLRKIIHEGKDFDPVYWERLFCVGVFLSGLSWGIAGSVLLPESFTHQVMMGCMLSGITAAASIAFCSSSMAAQIFLFTCLTPYILTLFFSKFTMGHELVAVALSYLVIFSILSLRVNKFALSTFSLGYEKDRLIEEIKSSKEALDLAQAIAHVGNAVIKPKTDTITWSDEIFRILELDPKIDKPSSELYYSLVHPDDVHDARSSIADSIKTKTSRAKDRRIITRSGNLKHISTKIAISTNVAGEVTTINIVVHDITDRKKAEIVLAQNYKMSALGEMAGGIAHEINTPLAIVAGKIDQLKDMLMRPSLDLEKAIQWSDKIKTTITRMAKITQSLKTFSKDADEDSFENTKLTDVVTESTNLYLNKLKENGIKFSIEIPVNMELECRSIQLCQVIFSLILNSIDAIRELPIKWIKITAQDIGSEIRFSVIDSGTGIKEELRNKIMQPFFTTKEIGKGMGLGLSVSRGMIESHCGRIEIDPTNHHTCFTITLPKKQNRKLAA